MNTTEGMNAVFDVPGSAWRRFWKRIYWAAFFIYHVLRFRPDVIHWYSGKAALPLGLDLLLVRLLHIPRLVEWQGTDIRIPEVEFADNPYYAVAYEQNYENKAKESRDISLSRQRRFALAKFACAAPVGMAQYIQPDLFPHIYVVPQRLVLADYEPAFPAPDKQVPLIVHSPSARGIKGTEWVIRAVEQLQNQHRFDFKLIQGVSRSEALQLMRDADIVLDQFVLGDRGMLSLEAMALGKPVVCYIKPTLEALYPGSPIVNTTPDTLADTLETLIVNAQLRHDLGRQARAYMEQNYDTSIIANQLVEVYCSVIEQF